jgi:hypothetical protein
MHWNLAFHQHLICQLALQLLTHPVFDSAAELLLYPITVKGPSGEQLELQVFICTLPY